ncbi:MAG: hypothetical protein ACOC9N_01125 [Gemmatimonadota bacterium]
MTGLLGWAKWIGVFVFRFYMLLCAVWGVAGPVLIDPSFAVLLVPPLLYFGYVVFSGYRSVPKQTSAVE